MANGDTLTGNGSETITFEGNPSQQFSAVNAVGSTTSIQNVGNIVLKGTWGGDGSVFYTNGADSKIDIDVTGNITSEGEIAGSIPFHAMGGTIEVKARGDIKLEGAGNAIFAQTNGGGAAGTVKVTAAGDVCVSTTGTAIGAASMTDENTSSVVTVSGKNVTVESEGTAISSYGKNYSTNVAIPNNNQVTITASESLSLKGVTANNATNGMSAEHGSGVTLSAKTITSEGAIKASTNANISIGQNEGFEKAYITGDVSAVGSSNIAMNLGNAGSLAGSVVRDEGSETVTSSVDLNLGTGSTWNVTGASSVTSVAGQGNLVLASKESTVAIDKVEGSVQAGFATLTADDFTDAEEVQSIVQVKEVAEGSQLVTTVEEGDIKGAITVTQDSEGTSSAEQSNGKLDSFDSVSVGSLMMWRHDMNDLTKRMGELRDSPAGVGSWVRLYGSEYERGATNVEAKNTSIQVGPDFDVGMGWKVGAAFSYTNSDVTMDNGTADGKMYGLALYGSWLHESGQFVDLIVKYTRIDNDFDIGNMSGSYDNNGYSVSAEYGWNLRFADVAFVEPQVELTYGTMTGDDFTASNGVVISQDDTDSFIGRLGVRGGFLFPNNKGTVYARASVLHDFDGETGFTATKGVSKTFTDDLGGTWYEFGVGANFNLTEQAYTYVDLERTASGDVNENWRWNVGLRYVW